MKTGRRFNTKMEMIQAIYFDVGEVQQEKEKPKKPKQKVFVPVDKWKPIDPEDRVVNLIKGYFIAPISTTYNLNIDPRMRFDYFVLSTKKCYNSQDMRDHLDQYVNYFETFYDPDREYIAVLYHLKSMMDKYDNDMYPSNVFFGDCYRYILVSNLQNKVTQMVEDNYHLELTYVNNKMPSLQYDNRHAKLLLQMSILMDLCIPLLTNYAYMHRVDNIDEYLMQFFDLVLNLYNVDMYSKMYETAYSNILNNQKSNQGIWDKQDIRAIDITTHSTHSVRNIILNIMPKYTFERNIISFNTASIRENTKYQVDAVA